MRLSRWFSVLLLSVPFFITSAFADYPTRGMSMKTVKAHYGAPYSVHKSASLSKTLAAHHRVELWRVFGLF
ncbi:MAG: hypothetical protein HZT40_07905 [Candidatus Thiothrix singaporensis]|uniref:Uncharacterized protein n=1 Tax=Candidatus Thiothrix singaporensis TaxID=2799669 RepID=A0A7L6AQU7_9GAMM|nr:MAG: hypothetical protein HZT40_07905 [Candidatus Thiothrix singaporensis]